MGYKITYDNAGNARFYSNNSRKLPKWAITLCCAIMLTAVLIYAGGGKFLRNFFMPGVSDAALSALAEDLRSGESLLDAVSAFCSEVVNNAKKPD